MKIKQEVRDLFVKMANSEIGSEEWKTASDELQKRWKFTPYNLLAVVEGVIEYNPKNKLLIQAEEKKAVTE